MNRKWMKSAAVCGLCLSLLMGGSIVRTAFGSGEVSQPGGWQGGPGANIEYASEPGVIATGSTTNSAASLTADYANAVTVTMTDENNEVKIKEAGTYIVTGSCVDGSITVTKGTTGVVLVLKDLTLTSSTGAPLSVNKTAEAKIVVSGSVTLTDAENPNDEDSADAEAADAYDGAAIKVKADAAAYLTGDGTLTLNITAANDAINGNYDVAILNGTLNIRAGDDAIHADRILTAGANGSGPNITITQCYEGIEATVVNIAGGTISVTATDDGINAANSDNAYASELVFSINIIGGSVNVNAGFDGLDSNGNVNLIAGSATIRSANNGGDAGIDYDGALYVSDTFVLNNQSGVAGPDGAPGMGGQQGAMPGQMGQGGTMPQNGRQGQMAPPTQGRNSQQGQMSLPPQGQNGQQGQMTPPTQSQNSQQGQTAPPAQSRSTGRETLSVALTTQNLTVNGVSRSAEIYNINGSNYFKLRDIAMLLNGTTSQFSVDYDAASRTVSVMTGESYTPQGSELQTGVDRSASCVRSTQTIVINGRSASLTAYNIGGNNFFQLRELGAALGFGVDYDQTTHTMVVTSK